MQTQHWYRLIAVTVITLCGLLLLAGLAATPAHAVGPIYVDDDTCPSIGSGTQLDPYCAIQHAVDAADPGDEIRVAEGRYTSISTRAGVTQVVYISKTMTLLGGYSANFSTRDPDAYPTTLDAEGAGRVLYITGEITSTLDGLRITGGDAGGLGGYYAGTYDAGGGMYIITATVTISNCSIYSNTASTVANGFGGGMYLYHSAFTLTRSLVTNNLGSPTGAGYGAGIAAQYCSPVLLNDNTVANNTASESATGSGFGGGLYLTNSDVTFKENLLENNIAGVNRNGNGGGGYFSYGTLTLDDNAVQDNTASMAATGYGGGLYLLHNSAVTLNRNMVQGNVASSVSTGVGGGMYSIDSVVARLNDNQVLGNTASSSGGGIFLLRSPTFTLTNNLIAGNYLGSSGLFVGGSNIVPVTGRLIHNTIANNAGVNGISVGDYVTLAFTNTILSGHSGTGIIVSTGSTATLEATLWYANGADTGGDGAVFTGTVNVYDDPAFVNPAAWNYHIGADSAAIDAGIDAGVPNDIDGDTRPLGSAPDIGMDELDPIAPTGVEISGPNTAIAHATKEFTADISPVTATAPFTYVWQAIGLPSVIHTGQDGEDTVSLTWSSAGPKTVTVTASNAAGAAIDTHTVSVIAAPILAISKSGPAEAVEGTPFTYTLTITNSGLAAASNLVITDVLPIEASYVSGGTYDPVEHTVTWTVSSLAANGGVAQVGFAVMATQSLTNSDYTVSADDSYGAVGAEPVVTVIHPAWIRYVAPGGADSGNTCANSATPCATVQHAVDVANPADEIRVAEGTYGPGQMVIDARTGYTYTQVVFITKTLALRGGYDATNWTTDPDPAAHPTVIDAEQQGRGVSIVGTSGNQPAVVIEGFTITGGDYTGLGNPAGVYNRVCHSYEADCGGGVFAQYSALTVRACLIHDNTAGTGDDGDGGGLYLWDIAAPGVLIDATTVISNSGQNQGGGLYSFGNTGLITIAHSTFRANSAVHGGALYTYDMDLAVIDSDFISNTATGQTGGVDVNFFSDVTMERVRFQGNQAVYNQAALYLYTTYSAAHAQLTNVLFSGNRTTATVNNADDAVVYVDNAGSNMQADLLHITAADNASPNFLHAKSWGAGHYLTVALTNTLVVNIPTAFAASETNDGTTLIRHTHTLTNGVATLHTTLEGTPTFVALDPISGDARLDTTYHLLSDSAAIDAGIDAGLLDDIDGDARPQGIAPDIGADESSYGGPEDCYIYLPLVMRDR